MMDCNQQNIQQNNFILAAELSPIISPKSSISNYFFSPRDTFFMNYIPATTSNKKPLNSDILNYKLLYNSIVFSILLFIVFHKFLELPTRCLATNKIFLILIMNGKIIPVIF